MSSPSRAPSRAPLARPSYRPDHVEARASVRARGPLAESLTSVEDEFRRLGSVPPGPAANDDGALSEDELLAIWSSYLL
jgi:hypothetical protein